MEEYKQKVINWKKSLGQEPPDDETLRSLCNTQIRPIIEHMMRYIRPVEEVQMVRRQVAVWKAKQKTEAEEKKPEDKERAALLRKHKALKTEVQEKAARQLAHKERIESLKREIEQKRRKALSLQQEICELNKQTLIVTAVSQRCTVKLSKQLQDSSVKLYCKIVNQNALSDSINKQLVEEWARLQVTRQTNYVLNNALKDVICTRSNSLRVDRDYLRMVLIDAEKKLNSLDERYKSVQKKLMQSAKDLSHSWQRIEEAAESARRKRSQLHTESQEAQIRLSELTHKLRSAAAAELKALHETMTSLMKREPSLQEVMDFGTTYDDLHYILQLLAQKRTARHRTLSLPKMFSPTEDARWDELLRVNSNETNNSEKYSKLSSTSETVKHIDELLSNNDMLIESLRDLIGIWWQPPFETAVPEDLVVSGKNILQHTAHWDRVTMFLGKRK